MRPKIAEIVPAEAWQHLQDIRRIIDELPETIETPAYVAGVRVSADIAISRVIPNCHVIARAVASFFPLDLHDGMVGTVREGKKIYLEHSWLTLQGGDERVIIDVWPLGTVGGPTVMIQDYAFHYGMECSFLRFREEQFLSEVDSTIAAFREVMCALWPDRLLEVA